MTVYKKARFNGWYSIIILFFMVTKTDKDNVCWVQIVQLVNSNKDL